MTQITVVGTGYVGLVTAAGLAHLGHTVTCMDIDADKIAGLQAARMPIFEAGLAELVASGVDAGRLSFQDRHDAASMASEFVYLCVPTPRSNGGDVDLTYLEAAAAAVAPGMQPGAVIVNKSTVPVGSASFVQGVIDRADVLVVSNPEFLREGTAVADFLRPDRIVIGSDDDQTAARVAALYEGIDSDVLLTDTASAELIKYASNAFLATKLSFINGIAAVCEGVGADIADVRRGIGADSRIGTGYLRPGPGWGGSCFPKDTEALLQISESAGYDFRLLREAIAANDWQLDRMIQKVTAAAGGSVSGKTLGVLGLAFKAGTDDTRMSPAIAVIERLVDLGASVQAFDPKATVEMHGVRIVVDAYAAAEQADVLLTLTEWPEFAALDMVKIAELMVGDAVVDTRDVLVVDDVLDAGLSLRRIGRA